MKARTPKPKLLLARLACAAVLGIGAAFTQVTAGSFTDANWTTVGSGVDSAVLALAVSGSDLYAGGGFTNAGGVTVNCIAKWNGSSWTALGSGTSGMTGLVRALAVSGSDLYAGGKFTTAGGTAANRIAKWDGTNWTTLGSGMSCDVFALAVSGSNLYAGGCFLTAGGSNVDFIAKWDGSNWSPLGSGLGPGRSLPPFPVDALAVSGNDLYVGGTFTTAGGLAATNIAKWDGSRWSSLGSGLNGAVYALAVFGSNLYVGGLFTTAGGLAATNIARWDGGGWSALGSGVNGIPGTVRSFAMSGGDVYVGGQFTTAGGSLASYIAKWDGSGWAPLGSGLDDYVYALAMSGSDLYVGGNFTSAGGRAAAFVARAYLLPPLPTLSVLRSGADATVSWPSAYSNDFALEQANALAAPASWVSNSASVSDDGTNKWVTVPATKGAQFFRLRRP